MKELESKTKTELSVKQKKQIARELIGEIIPHEGHTIWQINNETKEIEPAKFSNATYTFGGENKKEIIVKVGYTYVSALNKINALKKYYKGKSGGKEINKETLEI